MSLPTSSTSESARHIISEKILSKFPDKIPIIIGGPLERKKYIVPCDIDVAQLIHHVRKMNPGLNSNETLFFFVQNKLLSGNMTINDLYKKYRSDDNFLHLECATENTFG